MRTQVAIAGGGPSGLMLGHLLHGCGLDSIVLERGSEEHVVARACAPACSSRARSISCTRRGRGRAARQRGDAPRRHRRGVPTASGIASISNG